jgi:hypothetical protein
MSDAGENRPGKEATEIARPGAVGGRFVDLYRAMIDRRWPEFDPISAVGL